MGIIPDIIVIIIVNDDDIRKLNKTEFSKQSKQKPSEALRRFLRYFVTRIVLDKT